MPAAKKGKAPTPAEVRAARAFLRKRGIGSHQIPPRRFAASAKETGKSFSELLRFIGRMLDGAQNEARQRREAIGRAAGDK